MSSLFGIQFFTNIYDYFEDFWVFALTYGCVFVVVIPKFYMFSLDYLWRNLNRKRLGTGVSCVNISVCERRISKVL